MQPHFNVSSLTNPSSRYSHYWQLTSSYSENASPLWGEVSYLIFTQLDKDIPIKGFLLEVYPMKTENKLWWHANVFKAINKDDANKYEFELYKHQDFNHLNNAKSWCEEEVLILLNFPIPEEKIQKSKYQTIVELVNSCDNLAPIQISELIQLCEKSISGNYALGVVGLNIIGEKEEAEKMEKQMQWIEQAIAILSKSD